MLTKIKQLKNHEGFMKYFKNTSWLFGEKILRMIVGLFVSIWVARYLGPEQFGIFSYAQAFVGLFAVFATLGLNGIVVRELIKGESDTSTLIGTVFYLKIIGAFIVLLFLAIAINFTSNDSQSNILIFIIASATIFQSFNVVDMYFQAKVLSKYVVYANVISLFISSTIKIILILNEAPLIDFAWIVLFDSFVLALGFVYFFLKYSTFNVNILIFDKSIAIALLRDSWPLILSGMMIMIYMNTDQIMIKEMIGSEAVGQYAVAVSLSGAWLFLPTIIISSVVPSIVNAKQISESLYHKRLQKLYDLTIWMSIIVAIVISILSDWIVNILYGEQYAQAASVLIINVWIGVFVCLGYISGQYLLIEKLTKKTFYKASVAAFFNVSLNYIMIPIYGIQGAAAATLFSQFVANYAYDIFDKSLHHQLKMKTMGFLPIHIFKGYEIHDNSKNFR